MKATFVKMLISLPLSVEQDLKKTIAPRKRSAFIAGIIAEKLVHLKRVTVFDDIDICRKENPRVNKGEILKLIQQGRSRNLPK